MIISNNREPNFDDFKNLVYNANNKLNEDAKRRPRYYLDRGAQKLEDDVECALNVAAKNTSFENTIKKVSGQKFPDIVAKKYYGVEVKSSKDENWITLGGSVNESTRIEDVERIFLTFGKLVSPVEFRSRPYEDCLSEVVVTHYPRYKINMNLKSGETIFDKMNTTYDDLRATGEPVREIVNYYKKQLKDGESLWWIDSNGTVEHTASAPMKIRFWRNLTENEKNEFMITAFVLFPNILSNSNKKYEQFALWLAQRGVLFTRDSFSAGGQVNIITKNKIFEKVPKIFSYIQFYNTEISSQIINMPEQILCETWRENKIDSNRINQWINIVSNKCALQNHDIRTLLNEIFNIK